MDNTPLTPEEILRKHFGPDIGNYEFDYTLVVAAMNEHNDTLQARVQELESKLVASVNACERWSNRWAEKNHQVFEQKSRIAELERDYATLATEYRNDHNAAKQHAETLMGLLERMVKKHFWFDPENPGKTPEQIWQSYRTEHGLQSPENPAP